MHRGYENDVEELEPFAFDDRDIEAARNPYAIKRGLSKNQQIYGTWADEEDEEIGNESTSANFETNVPSYKKNKLSKGVNFVSGGIKYGDQIKKEDGDDSDEEELTDPLETKVFAKRKAKSMGGNVFAGLRTSEVLDDKPLWARHEKGNVIMSMMKKMGYVPGKGLGAKEQGIVEPIEARKRPGRGALGAYGSEKRTSVQIGDSAETSQGRESEEKEKRFKKGNWKKTGSASQKSKVLLKTVDDVLAENDIFPRKEVKGIGVKVIDMTGREQKVYSGYDAYAAKTRAIAETENEDLAFDVPELRHNIITLLDLTENTIKQNDRQLRFLKDQTEVLENERQNLKELRDADDRESKRLVSLQNVLHVFFKVNHEDLSMDDCYDLFIKLQKDYFEEYRLFNLDQLAVVSLLAPIKTIFAQWNSLDDPTYSLDIMKKWKAILSKDESVSDYSAGDLSKPFNKLLWESWMPAVRRLALSWNPRENPYEMLEIINCWAQILPAWMRENLLDQVILPRIVDEVDKWNPTHDTIPIHTWLLPWLDNVGDRLLTIHAPIRQKLARALRDWNPSDQSAHSLLKPLKNVFPPATMSAFLAHNIIPKLEKSLREMDFDPNRNRRYLEFHAVLAWTDILGAEGVASILIRAFFPKWLDALKTWLESSNVIQHEVIAWYNEWKNRIPYEIVENDVIKDQLMRGLVMMNQFRLGYPLLKQAPPEIPIGFINPPPPPRIPPPPQMQLTFKEMVENRARSLGIIFVPQANKFYNNKQVYWFANTSIYFDRNVIYKYKPETKQWFPISFDSLFATC